MHKLEIAAFEPDQVGCSDLYEQMLISNSTGPHQRLWKISEDIRTPTSQCETRQSMNLQHAGYSTETTHAHTLAPW